MLRAKKQSSSSPGDRWTICSAAECRGDSSGDNIRRRGAERRRVDRGDPFHFGEETAKGAERELQPVVEAAVSVFPGDADRVAEVHLCAAADVARGVIQRLESRIIVAFRAARGGVRAGVFVEVGKLD